MQSHKPHLIGVTSNVKLVITLAVLIAAYALAVHLGVSERIAGLVTIVLLAETCISSAFAKELKKKNRDALKNSADARVSATR